MCLGNGTIQYRVFVDVYWKDNNCTRYGKDSNSAGAKEAPNKNGTQMFLSITS
jgi:hypothetical protein